MAEPRVVLDRRQYLEAPRWRPDGLYVSDIQGDEVVRVGPDGRMDVIAAQPGLSPCGLGWARDGALLIVSVRSMLLYRASPGGLEVVADLSQVASCITNDMVVDVFGHAFIGQAGADVPGGEPAPPSPLLRVDPDWSVHRAAEELVCANGMVVTDGGRKLLVAETFEDRITAFVLGPDGGLSGRSVWVQLPAGSAPDGICLDAEGAVWAACPYLGEFLRIDVTGTVRESIPVPGRRAIACALGGETGRTLFMVTVDAQDDMADVATTRPSRVEAVEVAVPGVQQP